MAPEQDEFDARAVSADIARIREKLHRLDEERRKTVEQLEQALHKAERRLPPDEPAED